MTLVIWLSETGNMKWTTGILPSSDQYLHSKFELNTDRRSRNSDKNKSRLTNSPRKTSSTTKLERCPLLTKPLIGKYSTTSPGRWYFPPCCGASVLARLYKTARPEPGREVRRVFSLWKGVNWFCPPFYHFE